MAKLIGKNWHLIHVAGPKFAIMKRAVKGPMAEDFYKLATVVRYMDGYRYEFPDTLGERGPFRSQEAVLAASFAEFERRKRADHWRHRREG